MADILAFPPPAGASYTCPSCGGGVKVEGECFECRARPEQDRFPVLDPVALHGPAGEFVNIMAPVSEAHPAALLFEFLATYGCAVGSGPALEVSGSRHPARLFVAIVGQSAFARKSSGRARVRPVIEAASDGFASRCYGAPSSGEGLLELVRDPVFDEDGRLKWGSPDRRLLLYMPELARLWRTMERSGQTTSPLLREAFDVGPLRIVRRMDPLVATDPHICVVGNVTGVELFGLMSSVDVWNGFANRFCYVMAATTHLLPHGGTPDQAAWSSLVARVRDALADARRVGTITWSPGAADRWVDVYRRMRETTADGPLAAMIARADVQVLRLAVVYTLTDGQGVIGERHLAAAEAAWAYADASARYMWNTWGASAASVEGLHKVAVSHAQTRLERILSACRPGEILTRTDLHALFARNIEMSVLERLMAQLVAAGDYTRWKATPGAQGRPASGWKRA